MRGGFRCRCAGFVVAGVVLAVSGCMIGPDYQRPEASVAESWSETTDERVKPESSDHRDWWNSLSDPTLAALIERAHQQNLPLRMAGIRILEARAQLGRAVGSLYPQKQGAFGSATRIDLSEDASPVSMGGLPFSDSLTGNFNNTQLGVAAIWEIDLWGKFRRGVQAADANYVASVATYDDFLVTLTAEVATAYVTIRTLEERLVLARENVSLQEQSYELADSRFRNGVTSELDVTQSSALLNTTRALVPVIETALQKARNGLAILLGTHSGEVEQMLGEAGSIPAAPTTVAVGIPADLMRRRPDIRLAELQAVAQCARIGIAKSDFLPSFGLIGAIGFSAESTGDLFNSDSRTGFGGPFAAWNVLNYGRISNNVRANDAAFQASLVNYQNVVLRAQREVEDALAGFLGSQEQAGSLAEAVKAAGRSVELAMAQYRDGSTSYTRVLDTQQFLTRQQDLLTTSRGDVCRNLIALYRSLGGGWQLRVGKEFVPEATKEEMRERTNWGDLLGTEIAEDEKTNPKTVRLPDL